MTELNNTLALATAESSVNARELTVQFSKSQSSVSDSITPSLKMSDYWYLAGLVLALF